jgi:hypothetical protein
VLSSILRPIYADSPLEVTVVDVGDLKNSAQNTRLLARAAIAAAVLETDVVSVSDLTSPNKGILTKACQQIRSIVDTIMKNVVEAG